MPPFYVFFSLHLPSAVSALAKGLAAPIIILVKGRKSTLTWLYFFEINHNLLLWHKALNAATVPPSVRGNLFCTCRGKLWH